MPALDDEFARSLGRQSLEDLKKEISGELEARARAGAEAEAENAMLNALIDGHSFKVPSGFVVRQLELMVEDSKRRLEEKGFKREDLDKRDGEFRQRMGPDAERQVRLLFILDAIAAAEKIEPGEDDLKNAYRAIAAETGKAEDAVREHYEKEGLVENLLEKIREGKTIKFLLDNAKVTEKEQA